MAIGDILAGGSPLAPTELQAQLAASLATNPVPYGGPLGQTFAAMSSGFDQSRAVNAARQIADVHQQAMPYLSKWYSAPDPVQAAANDPDAPAFAKWMMFNQSPEQMAVSRIRFAQAGALEPEAAQARAALPLALRGIERQVQRGQPGTTPGTTAAPGTATGEPAATANLPQFPGRLSQTETAPAAPAQPAAETAAVDDEVSKLPADPAQAAAYYNKLSGPRQTRLRLQLRQRMQQQQLAAARPAGT